MANINTMIAADMAATAFDVDDAASPADTVSYTPVGGEAADVSAIIAGPEVIVENDDDGRFETAVINIAVRQSDVTTINYGDTITYDDKVYTFSAGRTARLEAGLWTAEFARAEQKRRQNEQTERTHR